MSKEEDTDAFGAWFKSATQYSIMLLIIIVLSTVLTISTKNKININFSKKENKRVLMGLLLVVLYIYRDSFSGWFDEIRKDAVEPGSGYFGKLYTAIKTNILSLNDGYLGDQIDSIDKEINGDALANEYTLSNVLKDQLVIDGAIGYIILKDGSVYAIKVNQGNKYFLESKIQRDTMTVDKINIESTELDYGAVYDKIQYKEIFESNYENFNIDAILVQPDVSVTNGTIDEDPCAKCGIRTLSEVEADKFSTVATVDEGELPACYKTDTVDQNGNPIYSCCIVEDSTSRYTCPDKCFEFPDNFDDKKFTADQYIDILKTNEYCSDIQLTTKPESYLDVIRI